MIRCLLLLVSRNRQGDVALDERVATGESLRIGRGTDCTVHLPDPRVNYQHAVIRMSRDGQCWVEAQGKDLRIDGRHAKDATLETGSRFDVGPYRLQVEAARPGYELVLSIELVQPLPDERRGLQARSRTSLSLSWLSRRRLALLLMSLVLALFLAAPLLYALHPGFRGQVAMLPAAPDESWNPGPVSAAHRAFGNNCGECHQQPFRQVQDQACVHCHEAVADHVTHKGLQAAAFGNTRCAQCHLEHKGSEGLVQDDSGQCVGCHRDIAARVPGSRSPAAHDFREGHPPFQLSMIAKPGSDQRIRVAQGATGLQEDSGLKFPHDLHLAEAGVDGPGGRQLLKCKSCHEADEAGMRFKPVLMQAHCAGCHQLAFEPAASSREVPHAPPAQVMLALREFYAGVSIGERAIDVATVDGRLQRPGAGSGDQARLAAGRWAEAKAMAVARELFEQRVCSTCHEVQRAAGDSEAPWRIAPVSQNLHWLPKARFDHSRHGNVGCVGCHDVAGSGRSGDINLPGIGVCRECHVGTTPMRNMIASQCTSCHGFHPDPQGAAGSLADAAGPANGRTDTP